MQHALQSSQFNAAAWFFALREYFKNNLIKFHCDSEISVLYAIKARIPKREKNDYLISGIIIRAALLGNGIFPTIMLHLPVILSI